MYAFKQLLSVSLLLACFGNTPVSAADLKAGEQKAGACQGCHGAQGKSNNSQWPNLAAQQSVYIVNQLHAFKESTRNNSMMQGMANNLSEDDINNLAAYFASLPAASTGSSNAGQAKSGQAKAGMCLGCHGPSAKGNGQFPGLAGQHSDYLIKQLENFKDGTRQNGPMQAITGNLSEEDMRQLAAYFASL